MNIHLPSPSAPDGFEDQVLMRAWLSALPQASAPEGFEQQVIKGARQSPLWLLNGFVLTMAVALGTWLGVQPHPIRVVHVPDVRATTIDLSNIPPAPVTEDLRFSARAVAIKIEKWPVVRTGY
jgi:hypothetical protein